LSITIVAWKDLLLNNSFIWKDTLMSPSPLIILCTCPDLATAERVAEAVVGERLAACVNIAPGLTSIYRWEGQIQRDAELLLLIKTRQEVYPLLEARIRELHPYQIPEIIALPIQAGSAAYLDWIAANTGAPT
jgi:periplasmic divalent cation tolerance protein